MVAREVDELASGRRIHQSATVLVGHECVSGAMHDEDGAVVIPDDIEIVEGVAHQSSGRPKTAGEVADAGECGQEHKAGGRPLGGKGTYGTAA